MEAVIPVLVILSIAVAWHWYLHKSSGGRMWSPLWIAFSTTAAALFFVVAGLTGFIASRRGQWLAGTAWSGGVIWWQVEVGVALAAIAAYFWYRASVATLRHDHDAV